MLAVSVDMIFARMYRWTAKSTLRMMDEKTAHHNPFINSGLVTLCFTSQLFPPQSQHHDFSAKQMALQCCTEMYLSHAGKGQGECSSTMHVTRYRLESQVEKETNNNLKSLLFGSDNPSDLCNSLWCKWELWPTIGTLSLACCQCFSDILGCLGVMFTFKESDLRLAKRFPSQQKHSELSKWP